LDTFWKNIKTFLTTSVRNQQESNKIKIEREKNEIMMKFLDCFNNNISWVFILHSENPVYKWLQFFFQIIKICKKINSKKMANFFVKTFEILKNQRVDNEVEKMDVFYLKKLQLSSGIYCPLNYESNFEEIELLEKILYSSQIIDSNKIENLEMSTTNSNLNVFLVKINGKEASKTLNQLLQNLNPYKIKIVDIIISKDEEFKRKIYENLELFNQNFTQNLIVHFSFRITHDVCYFFIRVSIGKTIQRGLFVFF